ncbi:transcriptional regulator with XRE-family HTH domain [Lipingzhangella halophila]|uniref:Transcriptional regulator with XRE-family HTH domain n=1 Tax=Lipingzhangella halophila TaxID=1783352 RepID=A0A7W7RP03_9ACTN|nr:helix-turn-helix transcriptional regulator [Lipingzhangella halophila]MBB4935525.1 transcriptional regulator with XRE-family HTH domain [Lipingzhangella halophila]
MTSEHWKRWGAELRRQRKKAGQSQSTIANAMNVARPTLGAFELGTRTPSREHAVAADEALSAGGALLHLWDEISDFKEIPEDWRNFEKIEMQATEIREYHSTLIPGLLQSPEYTRAMLRNTDAWADDQIERLVTARTARLDNLGQAALSFVVDEVVLRRSHGSWDTLRAQLAHIRKLIDERRIRIRVLPQETLSHPGPGGSFRIMTLRDGRIVGHEEYRSGVNVVTGPPVNRLVTVFGNLQGEALSTPASIELVDAIMKEL